MSFKIKIKDQVKKKKKFKTLTEIKLKYCRYYLAILKI